MRHAILSKQVSEHLKTKKKVQNLRKNSTKYNRSLSTLLGLPADTPLALAISPEVHVCQYKVSFSITYGSFTRRFWYVASDKALLSGSFGMHMPLWVCVPILCNAASPSRDIINTPAFWSSLSFVSIL